MVALLTLAWLLAQSGVFVLIVSSNKLGSCYNKTTDGLKVVLSNVARPDVCKMAPVVDLDNMMARCSTFCGPNGIPIPIGTESSGFGQADMNEVCLKSTDGGLKYAPGLVQQCKDWSGAIPKIKDGAADLIAAIMSFTYEQQYYKSSMGDKVKAVQAEMRSQVTKDAIEGARIDQKMEEIMKIFRNHYADLVSDGLLSRRLKQSMDNMELKSEALDDVLDKELGNLESFMENCNELMLGTGPNQEYLLDICSVTSNECIESVFGRHAGCCCGIVPAAYIFDIPANTFMSRRLSENLGASFVHTCGLAYERASGPVATIVDDIAGTTAGASTLQSLGDQLKTTYPSYYSDCNSRRLEVHDDSRKPSHDDDISSSLGVARELADYLTCTAPDASSDKSLTPPETLKVAFTDTTKKDMCNGIPLTDEKMGDMCDAFCAPTSIPLLLGSTSFGFSQQAMDEMCLRPDWKGTSFYPYSAEKINQCHVRGQAFNDIQLKTADLVAKLDILDAQQLLFIAKAREASSSLQDAIKTHAPTEIDNKVQSQKINGLKSLLTDALQDFMGNAVATSALRDAISGVNSSAKILSDTLKAGIPAVKLFITDCNGLATGVGQDLEYLLDVCSQNSIACIEHEEASHVGCCCGYNPVTRFGELIPQSIEGIPLTIDGWQQSRRLASSTRIDICAEAKQQSQDDVSRLQSQSNAIDPTVWNSRQAFQQNEYPTYFNRCEDPPWSAGRRRSGQPAPPSSPPSSPPSPPPSPPTLSPKPSLEQQTSASHQVAHVLIAFLGCVVLSLLREFP